MISQTLHADMQQTLLDTAAVYAIRRNSSMTEHAD